MVQTTGGPIGVASLSQLLNHAVLRMAPVEVAGELREAQVRCESSCAAAEALRMQRAHHLTVADIRHARESGPQAQLSRFKPAPLSEANQRPQGADDGLHLAQSFSASRRTNLRQSGDRSPLLYSGKYLASKHRR